MKQEPISAIIEIFPENGRVKHKTTLKSDTILTKDQKRQLNTAVDEARRTGYNIWRQHHSAFMIRKECFIK